MASLAQKNGTLGRRLAAHLLRRCNYQVTKARIDQYANYSASQAVDRLLRNEPKPQVVGPVDPNNGKTWINNNDLSNTENNQGRKYVKSWWINEARRDYTINHKMMFFLHTNFGTSVTGRDSDELYDHLSLLKHYALGNIKTLAYKMILDVLMSRYLGHHTSHKNNPNENLSREFLELFTITKGPQIAPGNYTTYTEYDITEAARLLTGFPLEKARSYKKVDPDTGIPLRSYANPNRHDQGDKTFSDAFQNRVIKGGSDEAGMYRELQDFVDMVFDQVATAQSICRRLYRFFVRRDISNEVERDIIKPLGQTLKGQNYNLKPVLSQLLKSQHFYDEDDGNANNEIIGSMVKSPLELVLQSISFFDLDVPHPSNNRKDFNQFFNKGMQDIMFSRAGFNIYEPPSVAGYSAYHQSPGFHRAWFNSNSIITRFKLPEMLIEGKRILAGGDLGGVKFDIVKFLNKKSLFPTPEHAESVVKTFLDYMFCEAPTTDRFNYFLNDVFLNGLSPKNWEFEWQNYKSSNDDSDVRIPLANLVKAVMYSPEYQLF
ncbi:MAG: DUF1800 family protein [Bacteroidota bacterium]